MDVSCATEVWIATALLHREHPDEEGFKTQKIVDKAYRLELAPAPRPGTVMHVTQHCIANRPPSPMVHRMLYELPDGRKRLFREGDDFHDGRRAGAVRPEREDVPEEYRELIDWYDEEFAVKSAA